MKKIIIFILLFTFSTTFALEENSTTENTKIYKWDAPKVYDTSKEFLEAEWKTCKSATDWCNRVFIQNWQLGWMTEMYCEDIYGPKWQEKWSCTDDELNILPEDVNYFNKKLFNKLDKNTTKLKEILKTTKTNKLEKVLEKISKQIETVKLSRIVKSMQDEKITKLYYIKFLILDELASR